MGGVEPCLVEFLWGRCGRVCKNDERLLIQCDRVPCRLVTVCEESVKGGYKIVGNLFNVWRWIFPQRSFFNQNLENFKFKQSLRQDSTFSNRCSEIRF